MKDILIKKAFLALTVALFWADDAMALSVKHYFDAIVGMFNASEADFTYDISNEKYAVRSNIYTKGVFDTLYPFAAKYATLGRIENDRMITEHYSYESQSRFNKRTKNMLYDDNGLPIKSISTKNGKKKEKQIKIKDDVNNTTDLQSVMAVMARQYLQVGKCKGLRKVFDGKRRYNVVFNDLGQDWLEKVEYSPYSGKAQKCSMSVDRLQEEGDDMLWKMTADRPVYFWIMQDSKSAAPFIARVKVGDTPLGEMTVYTTKIEVKKE